MRIFASRWVGLPLLPLAGVYALGWLARTALYRLGIRGSTYVGVPTVSIGNLTVGGAGKTPFTIWVAGELLGRGIRVAVISRGWRRRSRGLLVVSEGAGPRVTVEEAGDEPFLIACRLPESVVIVDADRVRGARLAIEKYSAQAIVLDDAFQHWRVARDLDVVLVDAEFGFGNGFLIPAGPLREPLRALRRANEVVLTRCAGGSREQHLRHLIGRVCGETPTCAEMRPCGFVTPDGRTISLDKLKGARVLAVSGIARPDQFLQTLRRSGIDIAGAMRFPDHHWYRPRDLAAIEAQAERTKAWAVVTTEKDLVRLEGQLGEFPLPWYALRIELRPADPELPRWRELFDALAARCPVEA